MKTRNKIILGICISIIVIVISSYFLIKIFNKYNNENESSEYAVTDECIDEQIMYEKGMFNEEIEASSTEEKVSPNANLIIEKKYKDCGHVTKQEVELPMEMINRTQEEIEELYKDFEVESFCSSEVVLIKELEGKCNEHYKIKEESSVIVIYTTNEIGEEVLYEKTGISTEYLTESDLDNIRNGLEIYGTQNLNSFIEDFE